MFGVAGVKGRIWSISPAMASGKGMFLYLSGSVWGVRVQGYKMGDTMKLHISGEDHLFPPAHPLRGATSCNSLSENPSTISTHAPLTGCDRVGT